MQTNLAAFVRQRPEYHELDSILRTCVHCGFCNATCPTYQLLGDERDGPRGRIYLLKQTMEGNAVSGLTQQHLDRCLSCRSCETTCPSGVKYGRLLDLGRSIVDEKVPRSFSDRLLRWLMLRILPYRQRFHLVMLMSRLVRPLLQPDIRGKIALTASQRPWPNQQHSRKMLAIKGCVQPVLAPSIDAAAAEVLDKLGITLVQVENSGCCGALSYHLSAHEQAKELARRNIDACWPYIEKGAEAVVVTASACALTLKEYSDILQHDLDYKAKALQFATLVKDISEVVGDEDLSGFRADRRKVAFQSPCTLQHGLKLNGRAEAVLRKVGYHLTDVPDAHLCCGSAGVYSLLQPELSRQLQQNKLHHLESGQPDVIVTANIGCLNHLQADTTRKVVHWIELLIENEESYE